METNHDQIECTISMAILILGPPLGLWLLFWFGIFIGRGLYKLKQVFYNILR